MCYLVFRMDGFVFFLFFFSFFRPSFFRKRLGSEGGGRGVVIRDLCEHDKTGMSTRPVDL